MKNEEKENQNTYSTGNNIGYEYSKGYETNNNNNQEKPNTNQSKSLNASKKPKTVILVLGIILSFFMLALGSFSFYIKSNYSAEKFLENNIKDINSWIDNNFAANNTSNSEAFSNLDSITKGSLKLNTDSPALKDLNKLSIDFNTELSLKNEYENISFNLKEDNINVVGANFSIDQDKVYIDSPDIYPNPLQYQLEQSPFASLADFDEYQQVLNMDNIKNILKKSIEYFGEALKNADMTTRSQGIDIVYIYKIDNVNKFKILNKFNELCENDADLKSFVDILKKAGFSLSSNIEPTTIEVNVGVFSKKINSFKVITDDEVYVGKKIGDNKYKVGNDNEYSEIEFTDNKIVITDFENKSSDAQFSIEWQDNNFTINLLANDINIEIDCQIEEANGDFKVKIENQDFNIRGNIKTTYNKNDSSSTCNGTFSIDAAGYKFNLDYDATTNRQENLVTKRSITNAKDINSLTEDDQNLISENLMTKLSNISLINNLLSNFAEFDEETSPYDPSF